MLDSPRCAHKKTTLGEGGYMALANRKSWLASLTD
jgi:hypothetical protein